MGWFLLRRRAESVWRGPGAASRASGPCGPGAIPGEARSVRKRVAGLAGLV